MVESTKDWFWLWVGLICNWKKCHYISNDRSMPWLYTEGITVKLLHAEWNMLLCYINCSLLHFVCLFVCFCEIYSPNWSTNCSCSLFNDHLHLPVYATCCPIRLRTIVAPVRQRPHSKHWGIAPYANYHQTSMRGWELVTCSGKERCRNSLWEYGRSKHIN